MRTTDIFRMSCVLVWRHKLRYRHAAVGMAIGTAGIVMVIALGGAVERKIMEQLDLIGGATILRLHSIELDNPHPAEFSSRDLDTLRGLGHVTAVAPVVRLNEIEAHTECCHWRPGLVGVDDSYWRMTYAAIVAGRPITSLDVDGRSSVCVVAPDVVTFLFEGRDPVGKILCAGNHQFRVVGVLGGVEMRNTAHEIYIPIGVASSGFPGMSAIREVFLRVDHVDNVRRILDRVVEVLEANQKGYGLGIRVTYFPQRIERVRAVLGDFRFVAMAAFVVAVIMGGVSLIRIMLSAIQERTREIGLRKAMGAADSVVLLQFLIESALISFLGGAIGIVVAVLSAGFVRTFVGIDVSLSGLCFGSLVCFVLNAIVGIVSGLYPAVRASRLDPAAAMRFE